ncbi:MAG: 3-phosphoshikimate 1-carboxyvinyltransferase [Planctomycetes bacterium]|nr:3-phosphoshikimate 1-carboxyvinyltransferase [Planctomycetota bacterium]
MPVEPLAVAPLPAPVTATWAVPGSKSITNRALVLAALAEGTSLIENVLESDDTRHMRTALTALGIDIVDYQAAQPDGGQAPALRVVGGRSRLKAPAQPLFIGNSGTTVRFLAAAAALVPGPVTLVGDAAMAKRPIQDLVDGLRQLGVRVDCANGCPPLTIHGGTLAGGQVRMRGDRSSQYFSALLMAAGLADGDVTVAIEGELVSRPYVDMTRRMIADFGGLVEESPDGFRVRRCASYRGRSYAVEPDASSASYPFAAAAATGSTITVPGMTARSLQGDYGFVEVLRRIGCDVRSDAAGTTVSAAPGLRGIDVDMHDISDTVMSLAAIAPLLAGPTTIRNVANIRIKECDRLTATVSELRRLGQRVEHGDDWLTIHPAPIVPATVECYHDHRIAMSFAVLGLARPGVTIADPACTAKTYPGFWDDLARLRSPLARGPRADPRPPTPDPRPL